MLDSVWRWLTARLFAPGREAPRRCRPALEALEGRAVPAVTYHGGGLLPHVEVQAVYLGAAWASQPALRARAAQLDRFLHDLVRSPYLDVLTRAGYHVARGSAAAGVIDPVPLGPVVTDARVQQVLDADIRGGTLARPDPNRLYVVFVEPGVIVDANTNPDVGGTSAGVFGAFLSYHDVFTAGTGARVPYAVVPYHGGPNGTDPRLSTFDGLTEAASHEVAEAVTDPGTRGDGWFDDRTGEEIADPTDRVARLGGYVVQQVVGPDGRVLLPAGARALLP